jgi:hypothetical protein
MVAACADDDDVPIDGLLDRLQRALGLSAGDVTAARVPGWAQRG